MKKARSRPRRDHPRSRGVYPGGIPPVRPVAGSSPLARGLHPGDRPDPIRSRIIPARAGFTAAGNRSSDRCADHPRSRGVYFRERDDGRSTHGSSPLARGLLDRHHSQGMVGRIIPARAGFTPAVTAYGLRTGDHPRSRGVYRRDLAARSPGPGSSPLARGLPK